MLECDVSKSSNGWYWKRNVGLSPAHSWGTGLINIKPRTNNCELIDAPTKSGIIDLSEAGLDERRGSH
jgi:hypothetical protein